MIRVFFKGNKVPDWLFKVTISEGYESDPDSSVGQVTFTGVSIVLHYKGHFIMYISGIDIRYAKNALIEEGGEGVIFCKSLRQMIGAISHINWVRGKGK